MSVEIKFSEKKKIVFDMLEKEKDVSKILNMPCHPLFFNQRQMS